MSKTYKIVSTTGIYEFSLSDDLRGIGSVCDKVVFDKASGRGYIERRIGKAVFDGVNIKVTAVVSNFADYTRFMSYGYPATTATNSTVLCNYFPQGYNFNNIYIGDNNRVSFFIMWNLLGISSSDDDATKLTKANTWFANLYSAGTPVTLYHQFATPTQTALTFTKVASSSATEVPLTFLTSTITANKVLNPTFTQDIASWTNSGLAAFNVISGEAVCLANSTNDAITQSLTTTSTSKYYVKVRMKATSNLVKATFADLTLAHTGGGAYEVLSGLATASAASHTLSLLDSRTSSWAAYYVGYAMVIDLTAAGLAAKTKAECDTLFANYPTSMTPSLWYPADPFSSGVETTKVIGRGKNLLDMTGISSTTSNGVTFTVNTDKSVTITGSTSSAAYLACGGVNASPYLGKSVVIPTTNITGARFYVHIQYADDTYTYNWLSSTGTKTGTVPVNANQIMIGIEITPTFITSGSVMYPQVEAGSTATSFETYQGRTTATIPTLRKIGTVTDVYNPLTGTKIQKISDWVTIDPSSSGASNFGPYTDRKCMSLSGFIPSMYNAKGLVLDEFSTQSVTTSDSLADVNKVCIGYYNNSLWFTLPNTKTGFMHTSDQPTSGEIKAYFYGWKMCNADGTSPYYKSEVPYTPATWAEWTLDNGATVDSTGTTFTSNGVNVIGIEMNTSVKASTKYGILYNVVSSTINGTLGFGSNSRAGDLGSGPKVVGNNKLVGTTLATIVSNSIIVYISASSTSGTSIKLKDFRIFELPTGSTIEADFTNLTADQLAAKYTFNGLCTKNWKKITDGTGLTSTLPTASYSGYTPYKMIYQLATPVVTTGTPAPLTLYPTTSTYIETDKALPSGNKADLLVGYKLKTGATPVGGDFAAPYPQFSSPCVTNLAASTYKTTSSDGIYEIILPEELRGVGSTIDRISFDKVSHKAYVERRIYKKVFDGTETVVTTTQNADGTYRHLFLCNPTFSLTSTAYSSHFTYADSGYSYGRLTFNRDAVYNYIRFDYNLAAGSDFKAWLTAQYNAGNPVTVYYQLATPTRTELTVTRKYSSSATEVPMAFLTSTTASNKVINPDFTQDISGWTNSGLATFNVVAGEAVCLANSQNDAITQTLTTVSGNKYYVKVRMKATSNLVNATFADQTLAHTGGGAYEVLSGIATGSATSHVLSLIDTRASAWAAYYVTYALVINLTAAGLQALTKAECDTKFANYPASMTPSLWYPATTPSVKGVRVKSTGKNLFNGAASYSGYGTAIFANNVLTVTGTWYITIGFSVKPNTNYFISGSASGTVYSKIKLWGDRGGSVLIQGDVLNSSFNTGLYNIVFLAFYSGTDTSGVSTYTNIQLEEGSSATAYEAYQESTAILPYAVPELKGINY
jgi:hypothetical protein